MMLRKFKGANEMTNEDLQQIADDIADDRAAVAERDAEHYDNVFSCREDE